MSNRKKKRRRNRPAGTGASAAGPTGNGTRGRQQREAAVGSKGPSRPDRALVARSSEPDDVADAGTPRAGRPRGLFGSRMREASPYPGFADSIRQGLLAAGSSTPTLAIAFVAPFGIWAAIVAIGAGDVLNPRSMANLLALPPLHLLFSDTQIAFLGLAGGSPALSLLAAVVLTLMRAVLFGAIIALLATRLGWVEPRPLRRWARAIPQLLLISFAFFGAGAAVPFLLLGFLGQLGTLAQLAGPVVALHFLAFAPVAAVLDGSGYRTAMWRSARAARLPGGSHLSLTFGYFATCLFLFSIVPAPGVTPATPSIRTWATALAATFLHVGVQGAFVYRWLAVGHHIPASIPPRTGRDPKARRSVWSLRGRSGN